MYDTAARACALDRGLARRALRCPPGCRLEWAGTRAPDAETNDLTPWLTQEWKIPPQQNAAFVAQMEDVRDGYARPLHPKRPLVCFDERTKQHLKEVIEPLPLQPGQPQRCERTDERGGVSNLCMCFAPLLNWRHVTVTDRRTAIDGAPCRKDLVDMHVPDAERVVVVQDNSSTHTPAALSAVFPPQEAKRMWDRLEVHATPTHGSWLNMAAIEFSVLRRPCPNRRIGDHPTLIEQIATWEDRRNAAKATVQWQFTTADARIKLTKRYPIVASIT